MNIYISMNVLRLLSYIVFIYAFFAQSLFADDTQSEFVSIISSEASQSSTEASIQDDNNNSSAPMAILESSDNSDEKALDLEIDNIINDGIVDKKTINSEKTNDDSIKKQAELLLENSNLNVVLLLDSSGSMKITDPLRLRDEGVRLFLQFLKEGDKVSIVEFSDKIKVLMKPAYFNKDGLDTLSEGLSLIENAGLYTDIYTAVKKAAEILKHESEEKDDFQNIIILFSDGKMEPDESIITKDDALSKLREEIIPELKQNNIKLYTLSFSDEADKDFLGALADSTGALSWFTPNADKIHESFSKLFLAVQKPQILPISEKGLRIDGQVDEATFYLTVKDNKEIVIISPDGRKIIKGTKDEDVRWFSGNKFEIITITKPEPGIWNFLGTISKDDFATVLTKLKLVTSWPYSVNAGEQNILQARVFDGKKPLVLPEISKLAKVAFRVTPTDRVSAPIAEGLLNDDGNSPDKVSLDGIFSENLKIDVPGEYELWLVIKTPTFERHQKIPFIVKASLITLNEPEFLQDKSAVFTISLNESALQLKNLNINLTAKKLNKTYDIPLIRNPQSDSELIGSSKSLREKGSYDIFASLSGIDDKGLPVSYVSRSIVFNQNLGLGEEGGTEKLKQIPIPSQNDFQDIEESKEETFLFQNLVVLLGNVLIAIFMIIAFRKNAGKKSQFDMSSFNVSDNILKKIDALDEKSKVQDVDTTNFVFVDEDDEDDETSSSDYSNINFENVTKVSHVDNVKKTDETKQETVQQESTDEAKETSASGNSENSSEAASEVSSETTSSTTNESSSQANDNNKQSDGDKK